MTPVLHPGAEGFLAVAAAIVVAAAIAAGTAKKEIVRLPAPQERLGCIDGVRGYLALAVLMHHFLLWLRYASGQPWAEPPSHVFNNLGQAAVVVFFMITGALFYGRVLVTGGVAIDWLRLYTSRIFRIVPLYWFAVAIVVVLAGIRTQTQSPPQLVSAVAQWLTFAGMPDIAGYPRTGQIVAYVPWTLQYEWAFYALLPALALAIAASRRASVPTITVPLILATIWASGVVSSDFASAAGIAFALGMIAVEVSNRPALQQWLQTNAAAALGVLALLIALTIFPRSFLVAPICLLAVFFVPIVCGNAYFGILKAPCSIVLGELSYSIYLLHGIVLSVFMTEALAAFALPVSPLLWTALPALTAITVVLSIASLRLIEKPAIAFGKSIDMRRHFAGERRQATN